LCRLLITEINANHEGRTPEALARNQLLIRELNGNIAKARMSLILPTGFSVHLHLALMQSDRVPNRKLPLVYVQAQQGR
jgi:Early Flowering 4 domain